VLQEGTFMPVGGTKPVKVDVRIIAASHKDLAAMVAAGTFREDLFYRINVINVMLPSLRERRDDVPVLIDYFLGRHSGDREAAAIDLNISRGYLDARILALGLQT
jgi:transcriptional regulator with PAS, ATPase and Fis domain